MYTGHSDVPSSLPGGVSAPCRSTDIVQPGSQEEPGLRVRYAYTKTVGGIADITLKQVQEILDHCDGQCFGRIDHTCGYSSDVVPRTVEEFLKMPTYLQAVVLKYGGHIIGDTRLPGSTVVSIKEIR